MLSTIFREVPSYVGYFGGYYSAKKTFQAIRGCEESELKPIDLFLSGGFAGFTCWGASYP